MQEVEETILLSSIIKSIYANHVNDSAKKIEIKPLFSEKNLNNSNGRAVNNENPDKIITEAKEASARLYEEAEARLLEVKQQIKAERQQWENEKVQLYEAEKKKGFNAGYSEGQHAGYQDYIALLEEAQAAVNVAKRDYTDYLSQAEEVILELGFTLAEKVIGQKLQRDNEQGFLSLVKQAIKEVRESKELRIFVAPCHYEMMCENKQQLFDILNGEASLFIYVDENLTGENCIIESVYGKLDASVDSQLMELKKKLKLRLMEEKQSESETAYS